MRRLHVVYAHAGWEVQCTVSSQLEALCHTNVTYQYFGTPWTDTGRLATNLLVIKLVKVMHAEVRAHIAFCTNTRAT